MWRLIVAATLFGATNLAGSTQIYAFSATQFFFPFAQYNIWPSNTGAESTAQLTARGAGSLTGFGINVITNAYATGTITNGTRIAGVNGNLVCSVAAGSTGIFSDTSHSDTVADGNLLDWYQTLPTTFNIAYSLTAVVCAYSATTGTKAVYGWSAPNVSGTGVSTASTSYYSPGVGGTGNNTVSELTSETATQQEALRAAGTVAHMQRRIITNGNANTATLHSRVTGADGNQSISIAAATTGLVEDTTHSDTVGATDTLDKRLLTGASTVNLVTAFDGYTFTPTGTGWDMFGEITNGQCTYTQGGANPCFVPLFGDNLTPTATESKAQLPALFALHNISHLRLNVSANLLGVASQLNFRKNAANGNGSASIGASSTGTFEDSTHSDTCVTGDKLNLAFAGSTVNNDTTVQWTGITLDTSAGGNPRIPRRWLWVA